MEKEKFYITTPIYYPSSTLTLGHCYSTVFCDSVARFNKLLGKDVFYLTGTDEHGQKVAAAAKAAGKTELEHCDGIVENAKHLWQVLNINYDRFIRTTDADHIKVAQHVFEELYRRGYIYKGSYSGKYCEPCESFWTASQLVDGKCPDCGRPVIDQAEEAYFFKLSSFAGKLLNLYKSNPEFLQPTSRINEMINNFIKPGLEDLCVSRTSVKWGIPVSFDTKHTIYVWIDALTNYLTGVGYLSDNEKFNKYWPADVHVIGKDIVRFHAIIWPAILMALDIPLPKQIVGHGFINIDGDKLSKSKANSKHSNLDPFMLAQRYTSDALRYVMLREMPYGNDLNYSNELLLSRRNSDLANNFGNLVSRTFSMLKKYNLSVIPNATASKDPIDQDLFNIVRTENANVKAYMAKYDLARALSSVFAIFDKANKYIELTEPYRLAKDEKQKARLNTVLRNLLECVRIGTTHLSAFLPDCSKKVLEALHTTPSLAGEEQFYALTAGEIVGELGILFPRLDIEKELEELENL